MVQGGGKCFLGVDHLKRKVTCVILNHSMPIQEVIDLPQKKEDLCVQKTKKNIKEPFLTLLEEKPLDKIHVQEILDTVQINRATFYKYYLDKYDLAE